MQRRNFLKHLSVFPTLSLIESLRANEDKLKKNGKSAILLWMGGGPSTMDIWDLKPGAPTGGPFRPISTSGDVQICEHMPLMAKQMHNAAIISKFAEDPELLVTPFLKPNFLQNSFSNFLTF